MITIPRIINIFLMVVVTHYALLLAGDASLSARRDQQNRKYYYLIAMLFSAIAFTNMLEMVVYILGLLHIGTKEVFGFIMSWKAFIGNLALAIILRIIYMQRVND